MHAIRSGVLAALALAWAGGLPAQSPLDKTGLAIGVKAPAFKLKDQKGNERALAEFLEKGKVALVFYRSASW